MTDVDTEEIASLRAEVERLASQREARPNPPQRARMAAYAIAVGAAALMFAAAYFGSPFLALHDLRQAARAGDRDRLEQLVDFPRVRESLKAKLGAYVLQSMRSDPDMANNPFAGLGALIVPAIADRVIDTYVTPDGIAAVVNNGTPPKLSASDAPARSQTDSSALKVSPNFEDLDHFKVALSRSESAQTKLTLVLERHGLFGWKLTRIDFDFPPASSQPATGAASTNTTAAPVAQDTPPMSDAGIAESGNAYAIAKVAAADFIIGHPDASDAEVISVATAAALQAGDPDAKSTGNYAASDAKDWIAARKSNGFPPLTTPAGLAANDGAADAAERRDCANMSAQYGKAVCSANAPDEPSRGAHYFPKVGACFDTQVASVASRLENTPGSGDEVGYTDGHSQVSYDTSPVVRAFHVGDPIRLCVTDLPGHCPPADDRGIGFVATDGRTGGRWEASDSEHQCGGA